MLLSLLLSLALQSQAAAPNTSAPQGGNFVLNLGTEPPTLHPIMSTDVSASTVQGFVMDTLLVHDQETYAWKARLAEKWEASKDGKTFTFWLRKNAVFHDGKPVTAEDVKFSYDAIFEPKYEAAHLRPYYEGIQKVDVIDQYTVKFTMKDTYYLNFDSAATMSIIPKHIYGDVNKSKKMTKEMIGAGPYKLEKFYKGQRLVLKKFDKWYGNSDEAYKGMYNFDTLTFRFVKEENVYLEMLKRGDIDYLRLTPEQFVKKTEGSGWTKIEKTKTENSEAKGYGFYGWNMNNDLFKDRKVRTALAHLVNRDEMNKKFRYGLSVLAIGPTYNVSDYASKKVKAIEFDPKKAQELLADAGWKDSDKDGILDKVINGKKVPFRFSLIHANKDNEKYHTFYKEDLRKAGIDMEVKYLEWNSFLKMLDDGKFEAVNLAWSGTIEWDPKQIWHSSSAVPGGSNFIGYKNPEVDKLIEKARMESDRAKRIPMLQKVYETIAADAPYAFLFNEKFVFYGANKKFGKPADTFKYDVGTDYWWLKP